MDLIISFGALEGGAVNSDGRMLGFVNSGMLAYGFLILVANLKIFLFMNTFNFLSIFVTIGSFLLYIASFALYNKISGTDVYMEFGL